MLARLYSSASSSFILHQSISNFCRQKWATKEFGCTAAKTLLSTICHWGKITHWANIPILDGHHQWILWVAAQLYQHRAVTRTPLY